MVTKAIAEIQVIPKIQEIRIIKALLAMKTQIKIIPVVIAQLQKMVTTAEIPTIKDQIIPAIKAQVALKILEILEIQVAKIAATKATAEIQAILKIQEIQIIKTIPVAKTQIKVIAVVVAQLQKMAITTAEIQVIKAVSLAKMPQI